MNIRISLLHRVAKLSTFTERGKTALWILWVLSGMQLGAAAPQNLNTLKFSEVVDKVMVIDSATQRSRQAKVDEIFKVPDQVSTGANSRAELVAPDGTVTRVGANTVFSFAADKREIQLKQGSVLFHSPTGKGGGVISTEGAQAAVMGTTLIVTATPSGGFKLLVMEGKAKATLPGGNSISVTAGQLTLINPGKRDFGPVLNFRLKDQVGGSNLMKGFSAPIASEQKVMDSMNRQERMIATGRAEPTNLRVRGEKLEQGPQGSQGSLKDLRTEKVAFKGLLNPTAAQISGAASANVNVNRLGGSPTENLLYWPRGNLSSALEGILGTNGSTAPSAQYAGKAIQMLLGNDLNIGGPTAEPLPEGGNLSQYLFPIQNGQTTSPWQAKIVAAKGLLAIDDYQLDPNGSPDSSSLAAINISNPLLPANENLLWITSKTSVEIRNTFLKARSDLLQIGVAESTLPMELTVKESIILNRSGEVKMFGNNINVEKSSIYGRGPVSIEAVNNVVISSQTNREIGPLNSPAALAICARTGVINVNYTPPTTPTTPGSLGPPTLTTPSATLTTLNGTSILLDAKTINLKDVNFAAGATVTLKSSLGQLATNPNTNQPSQPEMVNFISGVKFGGVLVHQNSTTAQLLGVNPGSPGTPGAPITGVTIQSNGR